jgi:CheY-like chemotaxis protein
MNLDGRAITILVAEDGESDRFLLQEALVEAGISNQVHFVCDGQELLDYLGQRGAYADPGSAPVPGLIIVDLNMPRMNGREVLRLLKAEDSLAGIPVVVLTGSTSDDDLRNSFSNGASWYVQKPDSFTGLVAVMRDLERYWIDICRHAEEYRRARTVHPG